MDAISYALRDSHSPVKSLVNAPENQMADSNYPRGNDPPIEPERRYQRRPRDLFVERERPVNVSTCRQWLSDPQQRLAQIVPRPARVEWIIDGLGQPRCPLSQR